MSFLRPLAVAFLLSSAVALGAAHGTHACTIDGKATAAADGHRAVRTTLRLTVTTARTWAPFVFRGRYQTAAPIRFTEDRAQLRRVLPSEAIGHGWRWTFGDGTHADGWTVTHRYARPGPFRITVEAYYPSWHRYLAFDTIRIVITR